MSDSETVPTDRVRIFDRLGTPLAEFTTNVQRSWVIGDEGRAQFRYPTRKTNVVNEGVLQFGNWLLVDSSTLPPWVGVIDVPRQWSTREVVVHAYSPERVFGWRIGPPEEVLNANAGTIFERLISRVNEAEQTIIRAGNIWKGGAQLQVTLNPNTLDEYLRDIYEQSGQEYGFSRHISADGRLAVHGNWLPFIGAETGVLLHEGQGGGNVEATGQILVEDGPIVNSAFAYGEGETWQSKPSVTLTKPLSIGRFGLRQAGVEYSGVTSATVLAENAGEYLRQFHVSAKTFSLNALNVGDTFKYTRPGNIFNVQFQNAGFRGGSVGFASRVRIIGMGYNPTTKNKVQLVVREVA
jgi:hypothetical protein